jgi:hypothetical protein|tara:strand:+ start:1720 stop:2316 length:597 start_codon:yes stop_codon:yes gene_type:complete
MSFIRKVSRQHNAAKPRAAPQNLNQPNFFVEMAPAMVPTHEFDLNVWNNQMAVITKLQQKYSDLNRLYPLALSEENGNRKYSQSSQFTNLSNVEHIMDVMEKFNLTMRLNIKRPSEHAATHTCMELGRQHLQRLVSEEGDTDLKTIQLRSKCDQAAEMPKNGDIFVTVRKQAGVHYFQHVDYEITDHHDNLLLNKITF